MVDDGELIRARADRWIVENHAGSAFKSKFAATGRQVNRCAIVGRGQLHRIAINVADKVSLPAGQSTDRT